MILHNHSIETIGALRDGGIVLGRNRVRIEEAAAVIELELSRRWKLEKCVIDLCRDRPERNRFAERVAPQVAHQTTKRALSIGEKDSGDRFDGPTVGTLVFDKILIGEIRIAYLSRRATAEYPGIAFRRFGWI